MKFIHTLCITAVLITLFGCGQNTNTEKEETTLNQAESQNSIAEITQEELGIFAELIESFYDLELADDDKMLKAISDHGFSLERFQELYRAEQVPGQQIGDSDEEFKKYEAAKKELDELQFESQVAMKDMIIESGISLERYNEIGTSLQSDAKLRERLKVIQEANKN